MKERKEVQFEQPSEILIIVNRYIMLLLGIIILLILGSGYWFLLKPKISDIHSVEAQVSQTQERKMLNEALVIKIRALETEYDNIKVNRQDDLSALTKIIPTDPKVAEMFVEADVLAQGRGFKLLSIEISEKVDASVSPVVENTENSIPTATSTKPIAIVPIKSMVVHMTIAKLDTDEVGPEAESTDNAYDDFKSYISDVENNIRLADIQSVNFGELSGASANSTFSFDLLTYYR